MEKTGCLIGHRSIERTPEMLRTLSEVMQTLIVRDQIKTFLLRSGSRFSEICLDVLYEEKRRHPEIRRICVRADYPEINEAYRAQLLERYDEALFAPPAAGAWERRYIARNEWMIDQSEVCVFYCPDYREMPVNGLFPSESARAYHDALQKGKRVINLADDRTLL